MSQRLLTNLYEEQTIFLLDIAEAARFGLCGIQQFQLNYSCLLNQFHQVSLF
jgi:hypothetical protein